MAVHIAIIALLSIVMLIPKSRLVKRAAKFETAGNIASAQTIT